ncbi:MAG: DUF5915 domain-containing protein, partial [Gemmatimonadota bacterium]
VSDRIQLAIAGSEKLERAVRAHSAGIGGETLALEVETGAGAAVGLEHVQDLEIAGEKATIALSRVVQASDDS